MRIRTTFVLAAALLAAAACGRTEERSVEIGSDTVKVKVPEDAAEKMQETGRRIGGAVGEAMQQTGQKIQKAGERLEQETAEEPADTTRP